MFPSDLSKRLKALQNYATKNLDIPINPFETWTTNYDIKALNRIVIKYLQQQINKIPQYEDKINELEKQLENAFTRVKKLNIEDQIKEFTDKINEIKSNPIKYKNIASKLLEEYLNVKDEKRRMEIIEEFLKMVKNFYPHSIVQESLNNKANHCSSCNVKLVEGDENLHCPKCFREYEDREDFQSFSQKSKSHDTINYFEKIIDQVEGREYIEISAEYKKRLDEIAERKGWKKPFTRSHVVELVYCCGDSSYYSHVSQIAFQYADIPLPDYSAQRAVLIEKYKQFSDIYQSIQRQLVSSLNGLFVIFKLLEMENNDLELRDFKASISDQTLSQYDSIWEQACERLGWPYIKTKNA